MSEAVGHCYYCGGDLPEGGSIRVQMNEGEPEREICVDCFKDWPPEGVDTDGGDEKSTVTVRELEHAANNTSVSRAKALALAANLNDGKISEEDAAEAFSVLKSDERRFDREFYPGDDAFDRADLRYGGIY